MKRSDVFGILFLLVFLLLLSFFPWNYGLNPADFMKGEEFYWTGFEWTKLDNFGNVTKEYPYIMGFFKFALLATFGEMLKNRMKSGSWKISKLFARAIVWGFFGMVMTVAFAIFAAGSASMMSRNLWFGSNPAISTGFGNTLIFAVSTSCFMNLIFAYPMMLAHEWASKVIDNGRFVGGELFFSGLNSHVWGSFIPKTILYFWIPAHTVTFLLPAEFRVLMGAALSAALGFLLNLKFTGKS